MRSLERSMPESFLNCWTKWRTKVDIEILTTQVSVTVGGLDLEDTLLDLENGDIEGSSTQDRRLQ
jgi:hypothetical protein